MSTKPFDEKAAIEAARTVGDNESSMEQGAFFRGCRWQHSQMQSQLEQKDAYLKEANERIKSLNYEIDGYVTADGLLMEKLEVLKNHLFNALDNREYQLVLDKLSALKEST
jgi:hypothetical protein